MHAKKKATKKAAPRKPRRTSRKPCQLCESLAGDVQRLLAELAEARRGREAWCHKAVETECRAEKAEEALRDLLAGITAPRPTVTQPAFATSHEPAPTYGLPGNAPLPKSDRFSREFRG